ncbi:hypothetical protein [Mycolicibacterium sp.]|uniref:hypothetical protein n=1 Tax=Mycolicibacterium sp. TaxID=2320850 RepID=UPI0037C65F30
MREDIQYLKLAGRLYPDNRLALRPAYTTTQPPVRIAEHGEITAETLTADGTLLGRWSLTARPYSSESALTLAVRGTIPLPQNTASILIWRDTDAVQPIRIGTLELPDSSPDVVWTSTPTRGAQGKITVRWESNGDPPPIEYRVHYSHDDGATWLPVSLRLTSTEHTVDLDELPGGDQCRLRVQATNGARSSEAVSAPFLVAVKPCVAIIQNPLDDTDVDSTVSLIGNGWHLESHAPEVEALRWESDIDGHLGDGTGIQATLTPGRHTITLTAGAADRRGTSSITITVRESTRAT